MKNLNKLGHIFIIASWSILIGYTLSLYTTIWLVPTLISGSIGYLVGVVIEAAQFDTHLQGILYSKSYKAMIKLKFGEQMQNESDFKFAIRTYDLQKTKQDLFFTNIIGACVGMASVVLLK